MDGFRPVHFLCAVEELFFNHEPHEKSLILIFEYSGVFRGSIASDETGHK